MHLYVAITVNFSDSWLWICFNPYILHCVGQAYPVTCWSKNIHCIELLSQCNYIIVG